MSRNGKKIAYPVKVLVEEGLDKERTPRFIKVEDEHGEDITVKIARVDCFGMRAMHELGIRGYRYEVTLKNGKVYELYDDDVGWFAVPVDADSKA